MTEKAYDAFHPWKIYRAAMDPALLRRHQQAAVPATLVPLSDHEAHLRDSDGLFFEDEELAGMMAALVRRAEAELGFALDWSSFGKLQMTRYLPGGRFDWHVDNDYLLEPTGLQRKWSVVCGISRPDIDFTGGGLEIMWSDAKQHAIRLEPGDVAVFPSTLLHRGRPLLQGERWVLVGWAHGPGLR